MGTLYCSWFFHKVRRRWQGRGCSEFKGVPCEHGSRLQGQGAHRAALPCPVEEKRHLGSLALCSVLGLPRRHLVFGALSLGSPDSGHQGAAVPSLQSLGCCWHLPWRCFPQGHRSSVDQLCSSFPATSTALGSCCGKSSGPGSFKMTKTLLTCH